MPARIRSPLNQLSSPLLIHLFVLLCAVSFFAGPELSRRVNVLMHPAIDARVASLSRLTFFIDANNNAIGLLLALTIRAAHALLLRVHERLEAFNLFLLAADGVGLDDVVGGNVLRPFLIRQRVLEKSFVILGD